MENELNILDQVQKVSAPPFLLTRIQQRIRNKKESQFSPTLSWVLSLSLAIVVVANGAVLTNMIIESKKEKTLLQGMNLLPNNELYK
ncbi:MAG: hypothetical protein U0T32_07655 [Chitinophagales bacterium]